MIITSRNDLEIKCEPCSSVEEGEEIGTQLLKELTGSKTGIGLAANQIGVPLRVFVVNMGVETDTDNLITLINPEITAMEGSESGEEGCLSIPDVVAEVNRATQIEIKAVDLNGKDIRYEASGILARALQHEMDHLNGILFWDSLGKIKRDILKRKFKKKLKEQEE